MRAVSFSAGLSACTKNSRTSPWKWSVSRSRARSRSRSRKAPRASFGAMKTPMMTKMTVAAATAFLCVSAGSADESTREQRVGARCWEDVRLLSDDAMEGRRAGSPGHRRAAEFVADNFRKAGLKPADATGFLQPVRLESRQINEANSSLALEVGGAQRALKFGDDAGLL